MAWFIYLVHRLLSAHEESWAHKDLQSNLNWCFSTSAFTSHPFHLPMLFLWLQHFVRSSLYCKTIHGSAIKIYICSFWYCLYKCVFSHLLEHHGFKEQISDEFQTSLHVQETLCIVLNNMELNKMELTLPMPVPCWVQRQNLGVIFMAGRQGLCLSCLSFNALHGVLHIISFQ